MKAIIMAGGFGSRLRPLTDELPKPMVPIINKPILSYIVGLLVRHGVKDIAMTLGYRPDAITEYFGDGSEFDCKIEYFVEPYPLGTAGGIKNAKEFIDDDFIVISGDALTNIDLSSMMRFHKSKKTLATIAVKEMENITGFGVVNFDANGIIQEFIEKPKFSVNKYVNTGIYIFKPEIIGYIPDGKYDFGRELFPRLVGELSAYRTDSYWSDIGTLSSYYLANNHVVTHPSEFNISI